MAPVVWRASSMGNLCLRLREGSVQGILHVFNLDDNLNLYLLVRLFSVLHVTRVCKRMGKQKSSGLRCLAEDGRK